MLKSTDADRNRAVAHILSAGPLVDFLRKICLPAVALPGYSVFRVLLHGHGFMLPVAESEPIIGFYTTYFVSGKNVRAAEGKALRRLRHQWEMFYPQASGELKIDVEELQRLDTKVVCGSRYGMAFYSSE